MPNWKRIIIGDAFVLPSRDVNYYRDLVLTPPAILFTIVAFIDWVAPGHDHRARGLKCAVLALGAVLLAREKILLFLTAVGICVARCLVVAIVLLDWRLLLGALVMAGLFCVVVYARRDYSPSYGWWVREEVTLVGLFVGLGSFVATLAAFQWQWLRIR
jgi:hypothetical protein